MRLQNKLGIAVIITVIVVIFSLQALAKKAEITGWDKAKFGMSPEQLKGVYVEEEEYFKPDAFWQEEKEDKFSHVPYTLFTSKLKVLGKRGRVIFFFVDDKLFEIIVAPGGSPRGKEIEFSPGEFIRRWEEGKLKGIMTLEERKKKMMESLEKLRLMKEERREEATKDKISGTDLRSSLSHIRYSLGADLIMKEKTIRDGMKENKPPELLTNKYGEPSIIEWGNGAIHRWDDEKGNILFLRDYVPLSADVPAGLTYHSFIIAYTNGELMKLWTAKIDEWKKERKRITEKGIEVF